MRPRVTPALLAALAGVCALAPSAARADERFTPATGSGSVQSSFAGDLLWSTRAAGDRTQLEAGFGDGAQPLAVAPYVEQSDDTTPGSRSRSADMGLDARGRRVAVYSRCAYDRAHDAGHCRSAEYLFASRQEKWLTAGACTDVHESIDRGTLVFDRGARNVRGARCVPGPYLERPGRAPQRLHPPNGCVPQDITDGVVVCMRFRFVNTGSHEAEWHYELWTLRLGTTAWRVAARSVLHLNRGGAWGERIGRPVIDRGWLYWLRATEPLQGATTFDIVRRSLRGGAVQRLDRRDRGWTDENNGDGLSAAGDTLGAFAISDGILYYSYDVEAGSPPGAPAAPLTAEIGRLDTTPFR